jgi:hydrogenase maturation protease
MTKWVLSGKNVPEPAPFRHTSPFSTVRNRKVADMKTLVVGLGNPILGDDGAGWRVAERVELLLMEGLAGPLGSPGVIGEIDFKYLCLGGLSLMEELIGVDRAIIIDALDTAQQPVGTVVSMHLEDLPNRAAGHLSSAHDTTLQNAIRVGESMGAMLPAEILIVAIEAEMDYQFSERLSAPVAAAVPEAALKVIGLLQERD